MPLLPDVTLIELAIIVGLAAFSAIAGGVAGYGTGALMPLILVPVVGAAPVVPIIAISALFSNTARVVAFRLGPTLVLGLQNPASQVTLPGMVLLQIWTHNGTVHLAHS